MNIIVWEEKYNTGIGIIDRQHQRIAEYINVLSELLERAGELDASAAQSVIEDTIDYTVSHFTFEEQLMERTRYPLTDAHKKRHENFRWRIQEYNRRFGEGNETIITEFRDFLMTWLLHHIQRDDQVYSRQMRLEINEIVNTL